MWFMHGLFKNFPGGGHQLSFLPTCGEKEEQHLVGIQRNLKLPRPGTGILFAYPWAIWRRTNTLLSQGGSPRPSWQIMGLCASCISPLIWVKVMSSKRYSRCSRMPWEPILTSHLNSCNPLMEEQGTLLYLPCLTHSSGLLSKWQDLVAVKDASIYLLKQIWIYQSLR